MYIPIHGLMKLKLRNLIEKLQKEQHYNFLKAGLVLRSTNKILYLKDDFADFCQMLIFRIYF